MLRSPQLVRKASLGLGLALGLATASSSSTFSTRPYPVSLLPFNVAAARSKKPTTPVDAERNPIDEFVVPTAKPLQPHPVKLFPGLSAPALFRPPVPTLSSGLTLEEQATVLESTLPYGIPGVENIIIRKPYVVSYNFRTKNANWVAEHYWRENMTSEREGKREDTQFMRDQSLPQIFSQSSGDYLKSGFSRGHLAPSASHALKQEDMQQTFSLTNIVPQNQIMNETDWLHLEKFCRHLTKHFGNVRIISGPMYIPTDSTEFTSITTQVIGANEVHVPSHLYKVIYLQGKDIVSHCHLHKNGGSCDLSPSILKNAVKFSLPSSVYSPYWKRMFDYISKLPDTSEVKMSLLQSFDWRTRIKHIFSIGELPNQLDEIVVFAFIMKNDKSSHGKALDTYMVRLPYVETLTGLCLTPRQDMDSITMATWNP